MEDKKPVKSEVVADKNEGESVAISSDTHKIEWFTKDNKVRLSKKTIIIAASIIGVVLLIVLIVVGITSAEKPFTVSELLEIAERYLLDRNYEQALVEFIRVIEVDPLEPRGYTGAADAYIGLGRLDDALDILEQGLIALPGNQEILAKLREIERLFHTHDWIEASCEEPKTCADCGDTDGVALLHTWKEANCLHPMTCEKCSEIEGDALGHIWIEATIYDPQTCEVCGITEGDPLPIPDTIMIRDMEFSTSLTRLDLNKNITLGLNLTNDDIIPLRYMINLEVLSLFGESIDDIAPLAGLKNLKTLELILWSDVKDLTPLAGLTNLSRLDIICNSGDITPLGNLTNLTYLYLSIWDISDFTPLASLTNLTNLYLQKTRNQISDITPLIGLTNLEILLIYDNKLTQAQLNDLRAALPNCDIRLP